VIDATCGHCGLPLGRRPVRATVDAVPLLCCCYGCVLAHQVTRADGDAGRAAGIYVRLGLGVFFAINVMMVSMPAYVPYVYGADVVPIDGPLFYVLRVLAIGLTAPVLVLLGWPIVASAWQGLLAGAANTDALIVLGTVAAYTLSVANTIAGRPAVYFDTAAMLLVLVTVGRYLEATAKAEAGAAVRARLVSLPPAATRERATGDVESAPPEALVVGDVVRVGPGAAFPSDGVVVTGTGGVDESMLTGESWPVSKEPGSPVAGGTCSVDGVFRVRVSRALRDGTAARIAELLNRALRERAPWERIADRAARWLVPAVIAIAAVAAIFWTHAEGIERGVLVGLAVLVVACPCGLGIATPVATWTGLATAARRGVVVRSAAALERAAGIRAVVFDKTGTLTARAPHLRAVEPAAGVDSAHVLSRAAAVARAVQHPLAAAIVTAAGALELPLLGEARSVPGQGARGVVDGIPVAIGSARFVSAIIGRVLAAGDDSGPAVYVVEGKRLLGVLRFVERPRSEAAGALAALRRLGLRVMLATGDRQASAVVPDLVAPEEAALGLLPDEKMARVRMLRDSAGPIAMVGDGVNDAPALAAADLGIAVAGATDLTRVNADVAILGDDLGRVAWLIAHARRTSRVARQNIVWAFVYNAVAIGFAAAGRLGPLVAAAAMLGSSLAVMANARRLAIES
jgi:heavy metal translocating P-type ATPase